MAAGVHGAEEVEGGKRWVRRAGILERDPSPCAFTDAHPRSPVCLQVYVSVVPSSLLGYRKRRNLSRIPAGQ